MKKLIAIIIILLAVYFSFKTIIPSEITSIDTPENEFSTQRALVHLKEISKDVHYLGSDAHNDVRDYIEKELQKLGLETHIQEGYSYSEKWGAFSKPKNILARIKGTSEGKALMLLTHYDSNPHSSFGASDAGSGVVTILEGLRAFLSKNKTPKNDIIILISDSEELGLNGADIFVNQHEWAKDIGLVLNFEARGSGGSSIMLIETNQGNANLMKEFVAANPKFPVANSLFYSIYKMLPNDTDLTIFRKDGDIDGFNFAFIDDHFDYHTALDTYERLDRNTLEHQGSYLMPLLYHFSESNLNNLKHKEDYIYFNVPFLKTIIYPFSWIMPMLILAIILFIILLFYGFKKQTINAKDVGKGFVALITSLIIVGAIGYFSWGFLKMLYPRYNEILHGFTYNGYTYISAFVCLSLAICFYIYHKVYKLENVASLLIAPLFLWLVICTGVALKLEGASFFIIPVFFGLLSLFVFIRQKEPSIILLTLLGLPVIMMLSYFVQMFPVGLGLKMMVISMVLVVLIFGLLISVFGFFKHKKRWSFLFLFMSIYFLVSAHFKSDFTEDSPKPNSLLYVLNADDNTAVWATYDETLDAWTKEFITDYPDEASDLKDYTIGSKYKSGFSFTKKAPIKAINKPVVEVSNDTIIGNLRHIEVCITSQRNVNRIEIFSDSTNIYKSFKVNGVNVPIDEERGNVFNKRNKSRLFSYHVTDEEPLNMIFSVPKNQETTFKIYEASYDLLENENFSVPKRELNMIPKPFVLNDAIVVKRTLSIK
jgi:hypothetical protein